MENQELKLKIQQEFINFYVMEYQLKSMIESIPEMGDLYDEMNKEERQIFYDSIGEVQDFLLEKYKLKT